ncbi:protein translocase subunit SecA [Tanacetum coccineum]
MHSEAQTKKSEENCSDILYAVSIKEDMVYLCQHCTRNHEEQRPIRHIQKTSIRRILFLSIGAATLKDWLIIEMKTGEGKTLVLMLTLYLNALAGESVHGVYAGESDIKIFLNEKYATLSTI